MRLAARVGEGVSVFVWGAREAQGVGRGRERSACRASLTPREPPTQAASRWTLTLQI